MKRKGFYWLKYKKGGKSVISVCKRSKRANMYILWLKKTRKLPGIVIYSYLKDGAFTAVKRDEKF